MENQNQMNPVVNALEQMIDNNGLKIELKIITNANSPILALVTLNIWPLIIKGFRLARRNYRNADDTDSIRLLSPSLSYVDKVTKQTKYAPIFKIDIYSIWKKLEAKIIEAYYQKIRNEQ